jgi:hypothetical protein
MEDLTKNEYIYVGVDPGKSGGIVGLYEDQTIAFKHKMPMIGKEYDESELCRIFSNPLISHVGLEDVHAIQSGKNGPKIGASSSFSFGEGKGLIRGILAGMAHKRTLIQAKAWQKIAWEGVKKQDNTKATSLIAAQRLFPSESFLATAKSSVPHDGIVDATLIAYYVLLKMRGISQ